MRLSGQMAKWTFLLLTGVSELRAANHTPHHQPVATAGRLATPTPAQCSGNPGPQCPLAKGPILRCISTTATAARWPYSARAAYKAADFSFDWPVCGAASQTRISTISCFPANKRPDMREHFVIDPLISKRQQLLLATQLCRMVLMVSALMAPITTLHTTPLLLSRDVLPSCSAASLTMPEQQM